MASSPQYLIILLLFIFVTLLCLVLVSLFRRRKSTAKIIRDQRQPISEQALTPLLEKILEFCKSNEWSNGLQALKANPELLTDETDRILEILIASYAHEQTAEAGIFFRTLRQRRDLLRRSREVGADQAFEEAVQANKSLNRIVWEFCKSHDESVGRDLLETHPELLSYQAEDALQEWIDSYTKQGEFSKVDILNQRLDVLRRVKEVGIDKALQELTTCKLPREVQDVIDEVPQLVQTKDMSRRIELCRKALALISREQNVQWWAWLQNQLAYGLVATPIGSHFENVRTAIKTLEKALQALDEREHSELVADLRMNLATCHAELGEYNSSRELFLSMLEAKQDSSTQRFRAQLLSNIGTTYLYSLIFDSKTSKYFSGRVTEDPESLERAIESYDQARQNLTPEVDPVSWININTFLGMLYSYRHTGSPDQNNQLAIEACQQALSMCSPEFQPWNCCIAANFLGSLYFELNDWSSAYEAFAIAIAAGEELYRLSYEPGQMQFFARMNEIVYDQMVGTCLKLRNDPGFAREALVYCETGRARSFREQIGQSRFPVPSAIPSHVLVHEHELLSDINEINRELERQQISLDEGQRLIESRKELRRKLEAFWNDLEQRYPSAKDYVAFRQAKASTWSELIDLANQLGQETAIVEFYALPDKLIAFVLRHGWEFPGIFELPISTEKLLARYVRPYMDEIINRSHYTTFVGEPVHDWLKLGEELLAPLESVLSGIRLVYFVPHDTLHIIPLHALSVNGRPFISRYAVAYAPSAAVLRRVLQRGASTDNNDVLVMGYTPNTDELERQVFFGEASTVAEYLGTKPLLEDAANSTAMRCLAPRAKFIHLSCHGSFVSSDLFGSYVLLADGEFTVREWMQLRLQADLITLSACQTGAHYYQSGDEIIGFSRALLSTGASAALLTLWSVDAFATAQWMQLFYQHIGDPTTDRQPAAFAFQKATLKLFEQNDDPYYWAPFILVGAGVTP